MLRKKLFQIDYLSTQSVPDLRQPCSTTASWEPRWQQAAEALQADLRAKRGSSCNWPAPTEAEDLSGDDFVVERLTVQGRRAGLQTGGKQLHPAQRRHQRADAGLGPGRDQGERGDLLELYCGNGNFSIALAQNFRKVLATGSPSRAWTPPSSTSPPTVSTT